MIIVIGFPRPPILRFPLAPKPKGIELWDSEKIPKSRPEKAFLDGVEMVYFHRSLIMGPIETRLINYFGPAKVRKVSNLKFLYRALKADFTTELAQAMVLYVLPPCGYRVRSEKVLRSIGRGTPLGCQPMGNVRSGG